MTISFIVTLFAVATLGFVLGLSVEEYKVMSQAERKQVAITSAMLVFIVIMGGIIK